MSTDLNIEKSAPLFRVGEHAGVVFAKDAITVSSDEAIDNIAKRSWNDFGY